MSEQLMTEDTTISEENKSSVENEIPSNNVTLAIRSKKKRKKNQNGSIDNVKLQEPLVETSGNCQEQSIEVVNAAEVDENKCSEMSQSNASPTPCPGKKKRKKKQQEGQDTLKENCTEHDSLNNISSLDCTPMEEDACPLPLANTYIKLDDVLIQEELARHDTSIIIGKDDLLENPLGVSSDIECVSMKNMSNVVNTFNGDDKALAPGRLAEVLEQKELARHDTSTIVGKNNLLENTLRVSSDIECASMEHTDNLDDTSNGDSGKDVLMTDLAGSNNEHTELCKHNANLNVHSGMHSAEEKKDTIEKASSDGSQVPSVATLDQKIQTKVEDSIASSSELGSLQANVAQPINQSSLEKVPSSCAKKKLLILDVNGLLADIVPYENLRYEPDAIISTKAVFKRPFCDDFLEFCFERFNVGVWSSRTKKNVERVLDFLFRRKGYNLLFCWDQSHCTETGFNTIENKDKPLVLKEIEKLWDGKDPDLPWKKGDYDKSNTLLLDDSPYKALRNPPNTAIFPYTFEYWHKMDNALAAKGSLRRYLERLAEADNVQKFVEQHPFGQRPITKTNVSWPFYLKIIGTTSSQTEDDDNGSLATKSQLEVGENSSSAIKSQPEDGGDGSSEIKFQLEAGDDSSSVPKSRPEAGDNSSSAIKLETVSTINSSSSPRSPPEAAGDNSSSAIESQPETAVKSHPEEAGDNLSLATKSRLGEDIVLD